MEKQPTPKFEKRSQKSIKKTPVKVVYISNPMKIKASPSEFRAVVQQLTGMKKDNHNQLEDEKAIGTRSNLCYEAGCREDQVMADHFIITPHMLDGFSTLLPADSGLDCYRS